MNLNKTLHKLNTGQSLKIIALGDSLTYGWLVDKGYLEFLEEKLTLKFHQSTMEIINRGIPGDTARGGLHRLKSQVIDSAPDLVLVQFGLNDAFSGCTLDEFKANIISIIDGIHSETEADILLVTSVALRGANKFAEKYYEALIEAGGEKDVSVARVHEYWEKHIAAGTDFYGLVIDDGVHPTEDGYSLMAGAVVEMFQVDTAHQST